MKINGYNRPIDRNQPENRRNHLFYGMIIVLIIFVVYMSIRDTNNQTSVNSDQNGVDESNKIPETPNISIPEKSDIIPNITDNVTITN